MIRFQPRTLLEHQQRYPAALSTVYDMESVMLGTATRAGERPEQIFDFADGLRLVVSRDRMSDGRVLIHVSASVHDGTELWKAVRAGAIGVPDFLAMAVLRFQNVSAFAGVMVFLGLSASKGVPHWSIPEPGCSRAVAEAEARAAGS